MVKLEMGKTYYPPKQDLFVTDTLVRGSGWQVEKIGESFVLDFPAARHGGGVDRHTITADEFDAVKRGKLSFDDLRRKYDAT